MTIKPTLNTFDATMIVVSLVIGIGIFRTPAMVASAARVSFGTFGRLFVSLAIGLSALGFLNVTLMQMPRAYYAMAEDRTLPKPFKQINPKTQTQEFGLLFLGGMIVFSIFFLGTFESIVNYVMFLDSLNIALVASTLFASGYPIFRLMRRVNRDLR